MAPKRVYPPKFPTRLSETGLFASTKDHRVAPGVLPYSVIAPQWTDGATKERFLDDYEANLRLLARKMRSPWRL